MIKSIGTLVRHSTTRHSTFGREFNIFRLSLFHGHQFPVLVEVPNNPKELKPEADTLPRIIRSLL
jgi:hypothetical protein